ncbi:hypothetical protein DERP_004883 [Dermatophagoides pteronyssinus]|uniref:Uncharacterized protein n=1 Tax=Dermatophagoides pteronyssinus TaxID=6956 RepID=A0ABQ8JTT8_DERPT|nr:hypothetical protein DERP_004883 [Dermatophagoides pteronyssinus]
MTDNNKLFAILVFRVQRNRGHKFAICSRSAVVLVRTISLRSIRQLASLYTPDTVAIRALTNALIACPIGATIPESKFNT